MNFDILTDEYIIREIQKGSVEYFRIIVERYENKIFSMGMRFFYNRDDSLDFTQEVFLKLFKNIGKYKEKAPFRFWLYRIAYNHGLNMKGKVTNSGTDPEYNELYSGDLSSEPGKIYNENALKEALIRAIDELPERYRICLDFYFFMGLKYREISEITGYPVNTIKSDVLRAKKMLRQTLRGTAAEVEDEM